LVLSYNDESWLGVDELEALCAEGGSGSGSGSGSGGQGGGGQGGVERAVATLAFDSARYVGARIGIHDPSGAKVGTVGRLSNQELLVIAGEEGLVRHVVESIGDELAGGVAGGALIPDRLQ